MTGYFKILSVGELFQVNKNDGSVMNKLNVVLQEFGSNQKFVATLLGEDALRTVHAGQLWLASLRFSTHTYQDREYQDVIVNEMWLLY